MIFKYDPRYSFFKPAVKTAMRLNFCKMVFVGKDEHVSKSKPIIFTPNHRNALLDALLLVYASYHSKQIVFLARADIFKKKFIAWLLEGIKIMPVYRIRDGRDNLDKNQEVFDNAAKILKKNNPIALFPEGRHNPKQSLLPIQKAAPRIVLPTEASNNFQLNSQIVPVGIYYRDISDFLTDVFVIFGEPIEVSKYRDIYYESPNKATNQLRSELEYNLRSLVVNIWNDDFYDEYRDAIFLNGDRISVEKFSDKKDGYLQASLYIVKKLDQLFEEDRATFDKKIKELTEAKQILTKYGLNVKDRIWKPLSLSQILLRSTLLVLSLPIALFGYINAIIPVLLNKKLLTLFEDKQFIPSIKLVSGLIFVPLFTILQTIFLGVIIHNWMLALVYFIIMPTTFYFALYWRKWYRTLRRDIKVYKFKKEYQEKWQRLINMINI